jgi:hypothetical protein
MTSPPMIADELRRQADQFIDLNSLSEFIAREGGAPRPAINPETGFVTDDEFGDEDETQAPSYLRG